MKKTKGKCIVQVLVRFLYDMREFLLNTLKHTLKYYNTHTFYVRTELLQYIYYVYILFILQTQKKLFSLTPTHHISLYTHILAPSHTLS